MPGLSWTRSSRDQATALQAELGSAVSIDPVELDACRLDKSGHRADSAPLAIVHAESIEQAPRMSSVRRIPLRCARREDASTRAR